MSTAFAVTAALALVLVGVLYAAYRRIGHLQAQSGQLQTRLDAAQEELAQLDERVKRRTGELDQAYRELVQVDHKDRLTGLTNRRHFDDVLANEFTRLKRSGQPLTLMLLSIDHFQNFNDVHGLPATDSMLQRVGQALAARMKRGSDQAARLGGGELALLLPETDFNGAKVVAEQVRRIVEQLGIRHQASSVAPVVTVSVGLATVSTTHLGAVEDLVQLAQGAVDRARAAGGNRVAASQRVRATPAP